MLLHRASVCIAAALFVAMVVAACSSDDEATKGGGAGDGGSGADGSAQGVDGSTDGGTAPPGDGSIAAPTVLTGERATAWNPGLLAKGGIPARADVCATVQAATFDNGAKEASGGIQAAIDGCPSGQVVQLGAGTFTLNSAVMLSKGITLRGAGAGVTILQKTNGAKVGSYEPANYDALVIVASSRFPSPDDATARDLSADAPHGATSVTLDDASGLAAGQFVLLDEDEFDHGQWLRQSATKEIWSFDYGVFMRHQPAADADDPFPDSLGWFSRKGRPVNELKEIASVSGNTVTFTSPVHVSYRRANKAQLTRYTGDNVQVVGAGIENLTGHGGSDGNFAFLSAAYSWAKNVESYHWLGHGFRIAGSFRVEVRDSYSHEAAWMFPGGGSYSVALENGSSEALIENNVIVMANKMMVANSAGAGSVFGYNYADDGNIGTDDSQDWMEVGLNASHMVGSHHVLFEGNDAFNADSDNTHGTSSYNTYFRNRLTGFRRTFKGKGNQRTAGLCWGSWYHSFVGNVLGVDGQMTGWDYEQTADWGDHPAIWRLGYDPTDWNLPGDPKVLATTLRHGNYDFLTKETHWDGAITERALPDSLYRRSKPSFFGAEPWPWVDAATGKLGKLPARVRFEAGTPNVVP